MTVKRPATKPRLSQQQLLGLKLGLLGGALFFALLICEGAARLFFPRYERAVDTANVDDNERIFARAANTRRHWQHPDRDREFDIVYNNLGLRHDRDISEAELARSTVVGIFGDSTTENQNMPAAYGYPDLLDALLNEHESSYEVLNFGVSGYGTDQSYLTWRKWTRNHKADVVVYMLCANDLRNTYETQLFELDPEGELRQTAPPGPNGFRSFLGSFYLTYLAIDASRRLGFGRFAERVSSSFGARGQMREAVIKRRDDAQARQMREHPLELSRPVFQDALRVQKKLLRRWQKEVEAKGAKFVLAYYPRPQEQILGSELGEGYSTINLYEKFKIRLGPDYRWRQISFVNDGHGSEYANQLVALELYPFIANQLDLVPFDEPTTEKILGEYYTGIATYYRPTQWITWPEDRSEKSKAFRRRYQTLLSE